MPDSQNAANLENNGEGHRANHDWLISLLDSHRIDYIDKRAKGGALWIPFYEGHKTIIDQIAQMGVRISFNEGGGRTTDYKSAWWTNTATSGDACQFPEDGEEKLCGLTQKEVDSSLTERRSECASGLQEDALKVNALEAKCEIGYFLKLPYDTSATLAKNHINYMGQLVNLGLEDLRNLNGMTARKAQNVKDSLIKRGYDFPIVLERPVASDANFYSTLIDDLDLPNGLLRLSVEDPDLNLTPGIIRACHALGVYTVSDMCGIEDELLLAQKGVGSKAITKTKCSLAKVSRKLDTDSPTCGDESRYGTEVDCGKHRGAAPMRSVRLVNIPPELTLSEEQKSLSLKDDFEFTRNALCALQSKGAEVVGDLLDLSVDDLLGCKGIGMGAIRKIGEQLAQKGIPTPIADEPTTSLTKALNCSIVIDERCRLSSSRANGCQLTLYGWLKNALDGIDLANKSSVLKSVSQLPVMGSGLYDAIVNELNSQENVLWEELSRSLSEELLAEIVNRIVVSILAKFPEELKDMPFSYFEALLPFSVDSRESGSFVDAASNTQRLGMIIFADQIAELIGSSRKLLEQVNSTRELLSKSIQDQYPSINQKQIDMYLDRNSELAKKATLQEVADKYGLTRERVRQIEQRTSSFYDPSRSMILLLPRILLLTRLVKLGGSLPIAKLNLLREPDDINAMDDIEAIAALSPDIAYSKTAQAIILNCTACEKCEKLAALATAIKLNSECMTYADFITECDCRSCSCFLRPNLIFLSQMSNLAVANNMIGEKGNPVMRALLHPESERAVLHSIMYQSSEPLTYDQMAEAIFQATGKLPTKAKVGSHVGSFADCMLWGRGTYIHEKNAPFPEESLGAVSNHIVELFDANNTPILGVEGIYSKFENLLRVQGVPTHQALYSLLRKYNDQRLKLQEYPWICDAQSIGERTSFAKYFYSVLEDNNGFITDEHAQAIARRTMAQSFALGGLAEYSPFLINANGGWYDIETAGFDMQGIEELANEVADSMGDDDIVSTVKVFEDYRARCHSLGVKSYDILYYLIDMIEDDLPIEASRRPHLVKSKTKHMSVREAVRRYIRNSSEPVPYYEIVEEFKINRGINIAGICNALLIGDDIVQTDLDEYWSKSKLGLSDDYIKYFETELTKRIGLCRKYSDLFYKRDEVLPNIRQVEAPHGLRWNDELLKTVVNNSYNFKLFGEHATCLVSLTDNPTVTTIESFYRNLIENEFLGWASFDQFADHCIGYGIRGHYEPEFFDAFDTIRANASSIECIA